MPGIRRKVSTREEGCRPGQDWEDLGCCQPGHLLPRRRTRCLDGRVPGRSSRDPGSEGTWGEAQVCPTYIPLGLGISRRRALLRERPRPWAHSSAGAAGRRCEGNSSGSHRLNLGSRGRVSTGQKQRSLS